MVDLLQHLQDLFGLDAFRPAQREVIEDVLGGRDVLCVMPTGAGKSLCYQLPATVGGGLTVVVSPLISLMADQVQQLSDEGITAAMLNSAMSPADQRAVLDELNNGFQGLLYVAPERFFSPAFQPTLGKLKVKMLAVDEAHCISQWGHDFRPEYSQLGRVREMLGRPVTIALTATATRDVRQDIVRLLDLREPSVYVTGFDRSNLIYESRTFNKVREKEQALLEMIRGSDGSGIVYCATRKGVDEVTALIADNVRGRPVFAYHAGMDAQSRATNQEKWMDTPKAVAVATNAFGMGINKPDTRFVIHYNIPGTLEAYYQEAGRAGRDGAPARCTILFSYQDRYTQEFFIDKIGAESEHPEHVDHDLVARQKENARRKLDLVIQYAQTHRCRRQMILDYFGDTAEVENCRCDVCRREQNLTEGSEQATATTVEMPAEVTQLVRQILSAIARMRGKFGVGIVAEVLAGAENERITRWGLDQLSVYGLLKAHSVKRIVVMLHKVMEAGLARQKDPDGVKFRPVVELTAAGVSVMKGEMSPPAMLIDIVPRGGGLRSEGRNPRALGTNPRAQRNGSAGDDELADYQPSPEEIERFERLRNARLRLARDKQLPPYVICHDSTLKLIAREAPATLADLESIKGMGPYKVKTYGQALLDASRGTGTTDNDGSEPADESEIPMPF